MPRVTFSDPGSENFGVANAQSTLRQMIDPSLEGTMQHKWMRKHSNIKPEIQWSQFRSRSAHEIEPLMEEGLEKEWYNPHIYIEMLVFRYIWMPLVQAELDGWVTRHNSYSKRSNRKTLLPHGRPKIIFKYPDQYDTTSCKITVPKEAIHEVRLRYADPTNPVFVWIPTAFEVQANIFFAEIGSPMISRDNAWGCYHHILSRFRFFALQDTIPQEVLLAGHMQANLLVQSESGAQHGDNWGYDIDDAAGVEVIGNVGYEDDEDVVNQNLEVVISGEEDFDANDLDDDFD